MNEFDRKDVDTIDVEKYIDAVTYRGKFEGEPPWTAYFYEKMLQGGYIEWETDERTGENWDILAIEEDEKEAFEEYDLEFNYVLLYQTSDGFIIGSQYRTIEEARAQFPSVHDDDEAENDAQTMTRSYDTSEEA